MRLELLASLLAFCAVGCTHTMEVVNLHQYQKTVVAPRSLKLSFERVASDDPAKQMAQDVKDELASHSSVERVAQLDLQPPDFHPDYVVKVAPVTKYTGSGWNYLVTFPGFLLFTHAWNGFVYHADTTTEIEVRRPDDSKILASRAVETDWNFRHCDFGRGAWTSSGWYTPFWGGLNLIIGFWMVGYDDDASLPLAFAIHDPYGEYIANNIVELVSTVDTAGATQPEAHASTQAPPPPGEPSPETPPP